MPKRQVSVPKREVCVPKRQVYVPKRQQLGLRGAETATFKKVPKWGVTQSDKLTKLLPQDRLLGAGIRDSHKLC